MKAGTIVKFIFAIIASLILLSIVFPNDGIDLFGTTLRFPSISEVIALNNDSIPNGNSPKDIIQQRKSDLEIAKENEFNSFCQKSPARFYMPNNNIAYLDAFFRALDNANKSSVRIMHYGDSQLECDRISCDLRLRFQSQFGGMGVGLIPVLQTIGTYTLNQNTSPQEVPRGLVYGSHENRLSHHRYGVMGQVTKIYGSVKVSVSGLGKHYPTSANFQKITVNAKGGSYKVVTSDTTYILKQDKNKLEEDIYSVILKKPVSRASIILNGNAEVYGIMLDGITGVTIDNIPMRGCSGTVFTEINPSSMAPFFQHENVGLIILQYGGNSVPYIKTKEQIEDFKQSIKKQINVFRQLAPNASMLFIGPADMATRQKGVMSTYPQMEDVVMALKDASNESGIAFWDMYSAMGGRNSIVKWVNARPQLAGSDHIHFTPKGAKEISDILYNTFQLYYKFYRYRNGLDKYSE